MRSGWCRMHNERTNAELSRSHSSPACLNAKPNRKGCENVRDSQPRTNSIEQRARLGSVPILTMSGADNWMRLHHINHPNKLPARSQRPSERNAIPGDDEVIFRVCVRYCWSCLCNCACVCRCVCVGVHYGWRKCVRTCGALNTQQSQ